MDYIKEEEYKGMKGYKFKVNKCFLGNNNTCP